MTLLLVATFRLQHMYFRVTREVCKRWYIWKSLNFLNVTLHLRILAAAFHHLGDSQLTIKSANVDYLYLFIYLYLFR
jgi:hypothetical protein